MLVFPGIYAMTVGILMIGQWAFLLASKQVPGLKSEPVEIRLHITIETITALLLVLSGAGLLFHSTWGTQIDPIAMGMLLYSVVNSAGYFIDRHTWPIVAMFALLLVLTLASLAIFLQNL
jgi:hypothetical protein